MAQAIGPYDGRKARKKRCDRCVERRIKCVGGCPCLNCTKTNRACHTTTARKTTGPIFVHATQASFPHRGRSHVTETVVDLPAQTSPVSSDFYVTYFFTSFLYQNSFTGITPQIGTALSSLLHYSPELHDAINAISALHMTRNGYLNSIQDDKLAALKAYSRSVQRVQGRIVSKSFVCDPSSLWTTLLLGIFELMRDHTGANWLAHFLNGTSTLLQLQGPGLLETQDKENEHRQAFFFSTRIFEISRALIYTEPTFLATPKWSTAIEAYWIQRPGAWTSKEALFNILPQFVDLAIRNLEFVISAEDMLWQEQNQCATSLAQEGLVLQSALLQWQLDSLLSTPPDIQENRTDAETLLAQLYYHTISIYLDGIFSYQVPFTATSAPVSPVLDRITVDNHVDSILSLSQGLLAQGTAGIFLFFPLRVAGARARNSWTQAEILRLLRIIVKRGFAVATSFVEDLNNLWVKWR
ncbi:uncharacterized protein M421DRAFT_416861 [Didymella exigua CBS 183.55]|uniref:Zn(2)-C6 fungal-type domain-containing protein n=1 Tax=Didymella exigua CBS 183.55 TaxID=1150837 RepID=A0A6A5RY44_9PLEO|nr:uncharacterized protein M421DRAFT_416861 [Didymella exigua CBS 183.55]KAF1932134.1 hypothetical protein M421DRAFT_416861 [Didymella exigua CBS 183.55]